MWGGERGYDGGSIPGTSLNSGALLLWQSGFPPQHSWLRISSLPSLQAVSSQPTAVLPLGFLSNPHIPALSLRVHRWTHVPVWGAQGCGTDRLCRSHSVLSATDQLLHPSSTASDAPLLSQLISLWVRGLPRMWETLLCFSSPWGADSILLPLLFFFLSFFCPTRLCRDLSCPFQCPKSSASVQLVFCEDYSICRCILFIVNLFIYLFILGCVGSSFLCEGFLQLRQAGATLHRGARASHYRSLSCCGAQAPDAQAQ